MRSLIVVITVLFLSSTAFAQKRPVAVFLAGDSTMAAKQPDKRPETGWGEMLQQHFREGAVVVENRAMNGRSTKSFIDEGRWKEIVDAVDRGDYVFIQFGHNDQKKDKPNVYASVEDYRKNLVTFVNDVRVKGGVPVLMTPVSRRRFENGALVRTHGEYPEVVKSVGSEHHVPVIDMEAKSSRLLTKYGAEGSSRLFLHLMPGVEANYPKGVEDNTHFSPLGAEEIAKQAVLGIREAKLGLRKLLKKQAVVTGDR